MSDGRTPTQLGETMAERMLDKHPSFAMPQEFLVSSNFNGFCDGRGFSKADRKECEDAYERRYRELT